MADSDRKRKTQSKLRALMGLTRTPITNPKSPLRNQETKPLSLQNKQNTLDTLRKRTQQITSRPPPMSLPAEPAGDISAVARGRQIETPYGTTWLIEERFATPHYHGDVLLNRLLEQDASRIADLAEGENLPVTDFSKAVFFDTETTGLATGAGTVIFLAGIGFFDGHDFLVRQFFLRTFTEESAFLWAVEQELAPFDTIVTYNGKSYDIPLLQSRFITASLDDPRLPGRHLDLLTPARRLWRLRLPDCQLTTIELLIFNLQRTGDIPSHLIPEIYFQYLRAGTLVGLRQILYHNRIDVVSLAAAAAMMLSILDDTQKTELPAEDQFSLARVYETKGNRDRAVQLYEQALAHGLSLKFDEEARIRLFHIHRRRGQAHLGFPYLKQLADAGVYFRLYALQEIAKIQEHQEQNYHAALQTVATALESWEQYHVANIPAGFLPDRRAFLHRQRRLQARRNGEPWRCPPQDIP